MLLVGGLLLAVTAIGTVPIPILAGAVVIMVFLLLGSATASLASGDSRKMLRGGAILALFGAFAVYFPPETMYAAFRGLTVVQWILPR